MGVEYWCSPLVRAMKTALPLAEKLDVIFRVHADLCEMGGLYVGVASARKRVPGKTRQELQQLFPRHFALEQVSESGWWNCDSMGFEEEHRYGERVDRVIQLIESKAQQWFNRNQHPDDPQPPGALVMVIHGYLLNSLLQRLLHVSTPDVYFEHRNVAVTHLSLHPNSGDIVNRPYTVRVHCVNQVDWNTPEDEHSRNKDCSI